MSSILITGATGNIGEAGAILLQQFTDYKNQSFELTGLENKSFAVVTAMINNAIQNPIRYQSVNPFKF